MYQNIFYERSRRLIHLWDDVTGYATYPLKKYAYYKSPNGEYTSMYGDTLTKTYRLEEGVPYFESDVAETTRFLIDNYTDSDLPSTGHRLMIYDIEVSMREGLPNPLKGENPITSISVFDVTTGKFYVLILDEKGHVESGVFDYKNWEVEVIPFDNEYNLLSSFLDIFQMISPTIITGWNIDGFDNPYIYHRICRKLSRTDATRLSPIGVVIFNPRHENLMIAGVSSLDYYTLYKNFTYKEQPTYRLDYIGQVEISMGKVEYEGSLDDLFETDINKFIEYNLVDVEIVARLDAKLKFIELARSICHAGHVAYDDFSYSSRWLDGAILTLLKRKGLVAPNRRKKRADEPSSFIGAFVKNPTPGRYEWIYDLDLTSLYPSIIMSLNISPETKVVKVTNWDSHDIISNKLKDVYHLSSGKSVTSDELMSILSDTNSTIASNGTIYRTDKRGVIPEILETWFEQRKKFKSLMKEHEAKGDMDKYHFYKKRQHVQKIFLNSMYGTLGFSSFRFYDLDNAEAVTLTGRDIIMSTAKVANHFYNERLAECIEIELNDGTIKRFAAEDKVIVNENGNLIEKKAKHLNEGDDIEPHT